MPVWWTSLTQWKKDRGLPAAGPGCQPRLQGDARSASVRRGCHRRADSRWKCHTCRATVAAVDVFGESLLEMSCWSLNWLSACLMTSEHHLDMRNRFFAAVPGAPLRASGFTNRMLPDGYTLLYQCTTHLVSGETYRRHFAQRDRELFRCHARGGTITSVASIPSISQLARNAGIEGVPAQQHRLCRLEKYWRNLRPDQFIIFMPCPEVALEDALRITGDGDSLSMLKWRSESWCGEGRLGLPWFCPLLLSCAPTGCLACGSASLQGRCGERRCMSRVDVVVEKGFEGTVDGGTVQNTIRIANNRYAVEVERKAGRCPVP